MQIDITEVTVITGHGPDHLYLQSSLPEGTYPYQGSADLKLTVAAGKGEAYAKLQFIGVPVEVINGTRSKNKSF